MIGSALVSLLRERSFPTVLAPARRELDLRDGRQVERYFAERRPEHVFMLAARVGGILANQTDPAGFLEENARIGLNVFSACRKHGTKKNLFVASSCVYPREAPQPVREESLLEGPFEPTNEGFALSKVMSVRLASYYERQYGLVTVCPVLCNTYGTNDSFDLERSHVLSALVRRFVDAVDRGADVVTLWGSGAPRRDFLHVDDAARALLFLMENVNDSSPVNVGPGDDVSIRDLAGTIARLTGFHGVIRWDRSRPDGMPRKCLDVSRLRGMGFRVEIGLDEGISRTIDEYRRRKAAGEI